MGASCASSRRSTTRSSPPATRSRRSCRSISPRATADDFGNVAGALRAQLGRLDGLVHTAAFLGSLGSDRAPVVRRVAEGAARQPRRGDGADALDAAAARRRRRTPASCSRSTRAATIRARTGARTRRRKPGSAALATTLADEWEARANLRVNAVVPGPMRSPLRMLTHPGEDRVRAAAARGARPALPVPPRRAAEGGERRAHRRAARGSRVTPASTPLVSTAAGGRP